MIGRVLLPLLALVALPATASPVLLDEVVAVVSFPGEDGRRVVLHSEVELEARLARALERGGPTLSIPVSPEELAISLERVLDELLLISEAERLAVFRLDEKAAEAAVKAARGRIGEIELSRYVDATGISDRAIDEAVLRDARIDRYLEGRFRLAARPRAAELRAYYDQHQTEQLVSFEEASVGIAARLEAERFQKLVTTFLADARRRSSIRVLRDLANPDAPPPTTGSARAGQGN